MSSPRLCTLVAYQSPELDGLIVLDVCPSMRHVLDDQACVWISKAVAAEAFAVLLETLQAELARRLQLFKQAQVTRLTDYNRVNERHPLPIATVLSEGWVELLDQVVVIDPGLVERFRSAGLYLSSLKRREDTAELPLTQNAFVMGLAMILMRGEATEYYFA